MPYFPKPSLNENDLAIIERGDTAAHSIEAGQYVSWHGRTGKAKAAILQGATLSDSLFDYDEDGTLNTLNSKLTNITSQTITLSSGAKVTFYRNGRIGQALFSAEGHAQTTAKKEFKMIPNDYIPSVFSITVLTNPGNIAYFRLNADGSIEYVNSDAWASGTLTYFVSA